MFVNFNKVELIKDAIESIHGSGVNYDYTFEIGYTRRYGVVLKATNAFDEMDEAGFYTDTVRFAIKVPVENPDDFIILLPAKHRGFDGLLKDCLDDLYASVLVK